jgi:hypothetical protein
MNILPESMKKTEENTRIDKGNRTKMRLGQNLPAEDQVSS